MILIILFRILYIKLLYRKIPHSYDQSVNSIIITT